MKKNKRDPLAELHRIRKEIYKKTKNMSASEYVNYIRKEAEKYKKLLKSKKTA